MKSQIFVGEKELKLYPTITNNQGVAVYTYNAVGEGSINITVAYVNKTSNSITIDDCIFFDKCNTVVDLSDKYTAVTGSLSNISTITHEGKEAYTVSEDLYFSTINTVPCKSIQIEADVWQSPEILPLGSKGSVILYMALYNTLNASNHRNRVIWIRHHSNYCRFGLTKQVEGTYVIDQTEDDCQYTGKWVHWTLTITEDGVYTLTNDITSKVFTGTNNVPFTNTYLRIAGNPDNYISNIKIKPL